MLHAMRRLHSSSVQRDLSGARPDLRPEPERIVFLPAERHAGMRSLLGADLRRRLFAARPGVYSSRGRIVCLRVARGALWG